MQRTKLEDRHLPGYTRSEEIFNMVTHIAGGGFGVIALVLCVIFAVLHHNWWGLAGGVIYGLMTIFLYTISSVYHGLRPERAKKVLQVLDHCTIYAMILGTYAPILLTGLRKVYPTRTLIITLVILAMTALGVTFTAIDFHRYAVIATGGYFVIGWSLLFSLSAVIEAFGKPLVWWLIAGGAVYTLGMIFFAVGMKKHYFHSVFHIFILVGSVLQFIGILQYCM
ncbi:MAG: hemolysin III family protein [Clostridia bacterium]|nr:hemolysin III family protein [Clostridia bacterium]